jgi:[ribosomal protein S5]-alanine N-acetyltransferase
MAIRPVELDDAPALSALYVRNRAFLEPYEQPRDEHFYTVDGQRERTRLALRFARQGQLLRFVVLDADDEIAGVIAIENVIRGPAQSASVGYWISQDRNGLGLATAAVADVVRIAFGELGLHRLQAGTLVDNLASQRVLAKNGFERIGVARRFLHIGGAWRDHVLFQRLAEDPA